MSSTEPRFGSKLGMILSVLGIAVGTGNIWRFPRIVAQNGGAEGAGAFLLVWILFLVVWSLPLIIAEYALGRHGRKGVVGAFVRAAGTRFAWMGAFVAFVAAAIMCYYAVVAGWCMYFFGLMLGAPLPETTAAAMAQWEGLQASYWPLILLVVALSIGGIIVVRGIAVIERVNKILIPTLLGIVVISVVRAVTLDGASAGLAFLFTPDWSILNNPTVWLEALTQNAWDTGAGWGLILTYGAYMQTRHGIVTSSLMTGIGNNLVSLMAAVMIFGTVFAILGAEMSRAEVLAVMQTSGPASTGLTFIWMPQLLGTLPGGKIFATLFFLGLSFAAFTSLISMIELSTRVLVDAGWERTKAVGTVIIFGIVVGSPSALNLTFLGNQDFVWGVALMISGALIALAVRAHGINTFRTAQIDASEDRVKAGRVWEILIGYIVPLQAAILLGWWLWRAATEYAPDSWYNPLDPYSVMTCLVQWGAMMALFYALNDRLARSGLETA